MLPTVILLQGPTASGKTNLAIELTHHLPCEIISVDSAMVYRGLDIGTGKPNLTLREKIPHHLIDILDPADIYSAGQFTRDAIEIMNQIIQNKKIPILVGGTHLYFKALTQGLATLPTADPHIRARIVEMAKTQGLEGLHQTLQHIDPVSAKRIHPNDAQRIQRALEVFYASGKPLSTLIQNTEPQTHFRYLSFAIAPSSRTLLHEKIALRFQHMLAQGFIEEVEALYQRQDLSLSLPSMRSVGYKQIYLYLSGKIDRKTMIEQAIAATRQLAKRQFTWLNQSQIPLHWLDSEDPDLLSHLLHQISLALM